MRATGYEPSSRQRRESTLNESQRLRLCLMLVAQISSSRVIVSITTCRQALARISGVRPSFVISVGYLDGEEMSFQPHIMDFDFIGVLALW